MESTPLLPDQKSPHQNSSFAAFFRAFWPLIFISFGGPQAHVALLHDKFVASPSRAPGTPRLRNSLFVELFALTQALPGPGSTQLVASLGATFGGAPGALLTFLAWHVPGFIVMSLAGLWFHAHLADPTSTALIVALTDHALGLIAAAYAFVLLAAFKIVTATCGRQQGAGGDNEPQRSAGAQFDQVKMAIALAAMLVAVTIPPAASSWVYIALLIAGGVLYYAYFITSSNPHDAVQEMDDDWEANVSPRTGAVLIAIVAIITVVVAMLPPSDLASRVLQIFWRVGLCVFGGGIVVIPMLISEFVDSGLLPTSVFMAGFGLFGCVPGPMFNLAPFLGAAVVSWRGALAGSIGLFGPGVLLQLGLLPFWERVRRAHWVRVVLQGTNAAAAGLILAGVWMLLKKTLVGPAAFALTCSAAAMSLVYKQPPAVVIFSHGVLGVLLVSLGIGGPFHSA